MMLETVSISLPGWEVVRKLGEGSFGGVYEIQRTLPDGTVEWAALKKLTVPKDPGEIAELYDQSYDSASITAHFKEQMQDLVREYTFMQKLGENPNVVHCQDLRTIQHEDGIGWDIYIRMELLKPLKKWLSDRYDERQVIRLGLNMCGALNGCHQRNIIHRDIKPENILVTEDGRFKLGDFGIAKISEKTATGTLTGTYSYMAPEIYHHQHYGTAADIYSLGLVMYWMMNERKLPFLPLDRKIPNGIQRQEAQDRRLSGEPIPAPVNGSLELTEIVLKACAFDPKERYHSVQELAEDLKWHYQNLRSGTVRKPKPANQPRTEGWEEPTIGTGKTYVPPIQEEPPKKKRGRWKPLAIAGIAALVIAVAGLGISISARTQRGKSESAEMVHTPQPSTVETAPDLTASAPEITLPPETEPVKIHVMAAAEGLTSVAWDKKAEQPFWGQTEYPRSDVKTVTFRSSLDGVPDNAWDVSEAKDRSILAWMESGNLFVAANGKIAPNSNASCLFAYFKNATAIDFGSCFDTSMVTNMDSMFYRCSNLTDLDISGFDTAKVTDMSSMFSGCSSLTDLDVSGFDTSKVTDIRCMFQSCSSLMKLDLSSFDTSRVTSMDNMFCGCTKLNALNLTGFDNNSLPSLENIFLNCNKLTDMQCHNQAIIDKYIDLVQTEPDFWIDVCYHLNGGHDGPDTQRFAVYNQTLTFIHPSVIPHREGYTFSGWLYGDSNAYNIDMPGEIVSWSEMYYSAPVDYYAQWRKNSVASEKSTDIPTERTVAYVNTVDELLDRIAPNTEVVLTSDFYDLSTAKHYGDWTPDSYVDFDDNIIWESQYYRWIAEYDGPKLVIHDVENMVIRSSTGDLLKHTISTIPRFANVLTFENCENITLQGFTAGHTKEQGHCRGGVIEFNNCLDTQINYCGLYGCGVVGVYYGSCKNGSISNSDIYDCSYFAVQGFDTSGVSIMNTTIRNIGTAFQFTDCEDIIVDEREISGMNYCGN